MDFSKVPVFEEEGEEGGRSGTPPSSGQAVGQSGRELDRVYDRRNGPFDRELPREAPHSAWRREDPGREDYMHHPSAWRRDEEQMHLRYGGPDRDRIEAHGYRVDRFPPHDHHHPAWEGRRPPGSGFEAENDHRFRRYERNSFFSSHPPQLLQRGPDHGTDPRRHAVGDPANITAARRGSLDAEAVGRSVEARRLPSSDRLPGAEARPPRETSPAAATRDGPRDAVPSRSLSQDASHVAPSDGSMPDRRRIVSDDLPRQATAEHAPDLQLPAPSAAAEMVLDAAQILALQKESMAAILERAKKRKEEEERLEREESERRRQAKLRELEEKLGKRKPDGTAPIASPKPSAELKAKAVSGRPVDGVAPQAEGADARNLVPADSSARNAVSVAPLHTAAAVLPGTASPVPDVGTAHIDALVAQTSRPRDAVRGQLWMPPNSQVKPSSEPTKGKRPTVAGTLDATKVKGTTGSGPSSSQALESTPPVPPRHQNAPNELPTRPSPARRQAPRVENLVASTPPRRQPAASTSSHSDNITKVMEKITNLRLSLSEPKEKREEPGDAGGNGPESDRKGAGLEEGQRSMESGKASEPVLQPGKASAGAEVASLDKGPNHLESGKDASDAASPKGPRSSRKPKSESNTPPRLDKARQREQQEGSAEFARARRSDGTVGGTPGTKSSDPEAASRRSGRAKGEKEQYKKHSDPWAISLPQSVSEAVRAKESDEGGKLPAGAKPASSTSNARMAQDAKAAAQLRDTGIPHLLQPSGVFPGGSTEGTPPSTLGLEPIWETIPGGHPGHQHTLPNSLSALEDEMHDSPLDELGRQLREVDAARGNLAVPFPAPRIELDGPVRPVQAVVYDSRGNPVPLVPFQHQSSILSGGGPLVPWALGPEVSTKKLPSGASPPAAGGLPSREAPSGSQSTRMSPHGAIAPLPPIGTPLTGRDRVGGPNGARRNAPAKEPERSNWNAMDGGGIVLNIAHARVPKSNVGKEGDGIRRAPGPAERRGDSGAPLQSESLFSTGVAQELQGAKGSPAATGRPARRRARGKGNPAGENQPRGELPEGARNSAVATSGVAPVPDRGDEAAGSTIAGEGPDGGGDGGTPRSRRGRGQRKKGTGNAGTEVPNGPTVDHPAGAEQPAEDGSQAAGQPSKGGPGGRRNRRSRGRGGKGGEAASGVTRRDVQADQP
ncbi:hypothetical protein DFJ74DRAFT_640187 [Hyaloraphidium curvatum]|nr:hypothetical protein DFJ74DRAFT_640187 [Hyaloraphidium curvatum]